MKNKKKNDMILIAGILLGMGLLLILSRFVFFKTGRVAVVSVDKQVILEQPLSEDCRIPIQTSKGYNLLQIQDGVVSIEEADCKDQICVEHVDIQRKGETIVCLPHKLVVEIQ